MTLIETCPSPFAVVFAGQGSQYPGMGHNLAHLSPIVGRTLEEADEALGFALSRVMAEGPEERLCETALTQPAILAVGVAQWRLFLEQDPGRRPLTVGGHSLGEYGALVIAEALDFSSALRLVHLRGRAMQEAVPLGVGAMAAVLGLEPEEVERLCAREARGRVLEVAGLNCPGQVSVAGHREAVEALIEAALAEGARNAALLKVSAPFHSSLMAAAADRLAEALASCVIDVPLCPIVPNVDAEPTRDPERIRENLVAQMTKPVRWEACLRRMMALGALSFLELGPGRSVAGMIRRVDRRAHVLSLDRSDVWR